MVARINTRKNIGKALNYNENKVKLGVAELIAANNFLKDVDQLNFYDKLNRFNSLISLNERTATNTLHVSLNFDPSEKLTSEILSNIADVYMNKIGFGNQPYLVYQHHDSGHPHIHIVSTNIDRHGNRISMHNLGRNQSEVARKEIEKQFKLVKAEDKKDLSSLKIQPINARKIIYGKSATKQSISNVLSAVLPYYKYSSLPELNAVLNMYNVAAHRGEESSRIFKTNGLIYHILDERGKKVGMPIKASSFFMKPTLAYLEKRFIENNYEKKVYKKRLTTAIDWIMLEPPNSIDAFIKALEKENINAVIRKNEIGIIYGITYIDQIAKTVFNGSDLGKGYSAKFIQEACSLLPHQNNSKLVAETPLAKMPFEDNIQIKSNIKKSSQQVNIQLATSSSASLIQTDYSAPFIPITKKKKKKRKLRL